MALPGRSAVAVPGANARAEDDEDGEEGKEGTSPEEEEYGRRYAEVVAGLKGRWMDVDLGGSLEPPRDLFVDVRVLRDGGVVEGEYGFVFSLYFGGGGVSFPFFPSPLLEKVRKELLLITKRVPGPLH